MRYQISTSSHRRGLKSLVKEWMDAVKNIVPVLAETMEAVRLKATIQKRRIRCSWTCTLQLSDGGL